MNRNDLTMTPTTNPQVIFGPPVQSAAETNQSEKWPLISLKRLELVNFGCHQHVLIDLTHENNPMHLACLVGPNGTGKTTILDAIRMLCSNFAGYDSKRFKAAMLNRVRNFMHMQNDKDLISADFEVNATFGYNDHSGDLKEYDVAFTRNGFLARHPPNIEANLVHYCFATRFDEELKNFQVRRDRWPLFQELFKAVTGFPIEEESTLFDDSTDTRMSRVVDEYVLGFSIKKDRETITHRQCSSGERKIMKCFSTILNKVIQPSIILIDNAVMHIEIGRHLAVIDALETCFPNSQMIVTCHSVPIQRCLPNRQRLMDMRHLTAPAIVLKEPWRLRVYDEVGEITSRLKLSSHPDKEELKKIVDMGESLVNDLLGIEGGAGLTGIELVKTCAEFMSSFPKLMFYDFVNTPPVKIMSVPDSIQTL